MPIPLMSKSSGVRFGDAAANLQLEVFIDIQCPHSKLAWPQIKSLIEQNTGSDLAITLQLITLSNHRQSWDISKGIFVYAKDDAARFLSFVDFLYQRQDEFYNRPFRNKTHQDLYDYVANMAFECGEFEPEKMVKHIDSSEVYTQARTPNRYAALKGVWGTPRFFINHAELLTVEADMPLAQWHELLAAI